MKNNYYIGYLYGTLKVAGSSRFGSEFNRGWFDAVIYQSKKSRLIRYFIYLILASGFFSLVAF
jgi:hypothetical protein